jgi:phosphohistidine phosphatase
LTAVGRAEVQDAADAIAQTRLSLDRVLVSTARRTLQTAFIVAERLPFTQPAERQDGLYLAAPAALLQAIARCPAVCHTLLVIGHNPGLSELAERLVADRESIGLRTAGVCLLTFASDGWRDLAADIATACRLLR